MQRGGKGGRGARYTNEWSQTLDDERGFLVLCNGHGPFPQVKTGGPRTVQETELGVRIRLFFSLTAATRRSFRYCEDEVKDFRRLPQMVDEQDERIELNSRA